MKRTPQLNHVCRLAGVSAIAFLSAGFGLTPLMAQNSQATPPSQSPTTPDNPNNSPVTPSDARNAPYEAAPQTSTSSDMNKSSSTLGWSDRHFLRKAAKGSEKEVTLAQLAGQRSSNDQVKQFAQQLASDHEKMNRQLEQLAQQKGLDLPTRTAEETGESSGGTGMAGAKTGTGSGKMNALSRSHDVRELADKSGADFDRAYLKQTVEDHQEDIKMFKKEAEKAKDPDVRTFASAQVSTLQEHLDRAQALSKSAAE
ncbi:MAG TPA: DUF4142 domain-containing protein [Opitutus sp.]|nr:DUF4142 domain-containing protein [Opitutus sp.]